MVSARLRRLDDRGLTLLELVTVAGILAVLMAASLPMYFGYLRTSALRGGAEELASVLMSARQLAIKENTIVCVTSNGTSVQLHVATCGAAAWIGPGTDAAGWITLGNNIRASTAAGVGVCFNYIGSSPVAPAPCSPALFTVTNPADGRTMTVRVAATGRVRIEP